MKYITGLLQKARFRREEGLFVCEGTRLVSEIPRELLHSIYCTPEYADSYGVPDAAEDVSFQLISGDVLKKISGVNTPQGIIAIARQNMTGPGGLIDAAGKDCLLLFLERIQDPGNLGTIIRTAESAGVSGIIISSDSVDVYSPKVVRSTMGSIFRMPLAKAEDFYGTLKDARDKNITLFASIPKHDARCYDECDFTNAAGILIGNEGSGLSREAVELSHETIFIPMRGRAESLNAAMACGIIVYEAARQRRQNGGNSYRVE